MRRKKIIDFVSAVDRYTAKLDGSLPLSESQKAEMQKYEDIRRRRDLPRGTKKLPHSS